MNTGEVDSMTTQQLCCEGDAEVVCSSTKRNSLWSPTAWIWRLCSALMVVFFTAAAYVQVRSLSAWKVRCKVSVAKPMNNVVG